MPRFEVTLAEQNAPTSNGKWLIRTDAAIRLGNKVICAYDWKNYQLRGKSLSRRVFTMAGR